MMKIKYSRRSYSCLINNPFFVHLMRYISTTTSCSIVDKSINQVPWLNEFVGSTEFSRLPKNVLSNDGISDNFTVENIEVEKMFSKNEDDSKPKHTGMVIAKAIRRAAKGKTEQEQAGGKKDYMRKIMNATRMPNASTLDEESLARSIRKQLVYADAKLVMLNKPYGLPVHGGDGVSKSVVDVLPIVSKMIYGLNTRIPLSACHRLDRYTTGLLVCSADAKLTSHLMQVFRQHTVVRKYWAIVVGTPNPPEGWIDIPLGERRVNDRMTDGSYARMVAKPRVRYDVATGEETRVASPGGDPAVTYYRVMDVNNGVSLLELRPETSAKHQLRVHTADCLNCPILGDHKYSSFGKLAPQQLPGKILRRFGLPRTKTRYIPLHLFHSSILIPDVFPEKRKPHLIVGAPIPRHMYRAMKMFGVRPGKPSEWKIKNTVPSDVEAKPRDPSNPLYVDVTRLDQSEPQKVSPADEKQCIKVFRPRIAVKYKRF